MENGSRTNIPFSGGRYESVYDCMIKLIEELKGNTYHRRKFECNLKCYVFKQPNKLSTDCSSRVAKFCIDEPTRVPTNVGIVLIGLRESSRKQVGF